MSSDRPTVLLTGPTGVVGAPLLERLPPDSVVCLVHSTAIDRPGVTVVRGDVTRPRLGLSAAEYGALTDRIDVVVHSAAATRFDLRRDEVFAVNVEGMARVLELVADAGARLVALSTAFVRAEAGAEVGWLSPKHYLDSKRAAESLLYDSGLDWHLVRPSVVIGNSDTGETARLQGFHFFMRALLRDMLPMIPVDDRHILDFVAVDLLAEILASIVDAAPPWAESWVTAGPQAWSARRVINAVVEIAAERGHPVPRPRLMDPEAVERLVRPVFFPELPKRVVRRYDQVAGFSTVVITHEPFESSVTELASHYGREWKLELERTLERTIGFLLESLGSPVSA